MAKSKLNRYPVPPRQVRDLYAAILPPGEAIAIETLVALRGTVQELDKLLVRWLGPDALTPGRFQVMIALLAQDTPVPQRHIVTALNVSRATISALVETLIAEGLVVGAANPEDKRQMLIALTAEGRGMAHRLISVNAGKLRRAFGMLTDEELAQLIAMMQRLSAGMRRQ